MALAVLAQSLLAQDKKTEALEHAREGRELLRSLGALEEGEALVRLTFAEALSALGDPEAPAAIVEAKHALLTRADNIHDTALRTSFLECVDENAATLAFAARVTTN
jgi:hypothetical protein